MVNFVAFANHNNFTVYHLFQCRDDLTNNQCSLCMSHAITQLNNIYFISYDNTLQFDNGFIKPGSFYQVPKKSYASNGPFTRVTSNNGDYLMKLTLGTPPVDVYGLVDTDSDLECNSFFDHSCSPEKACDYVYAYADDSATKGMLAKEIATFSSTDGKPIVESIIFGCGHNNTGVFNENDMGLIGLGGGPLSLVSQMGNLYGSKRFSQCLVPFHADPHTSGTISLGEASDVSGEGVVTTPLVSEEGTPETYLPQEFYDRLVEELKVQINLPPIHVDPDLGTQLCYKSETNLEGPILTAHFEGADVKLLPLQTFIPPKDGVFCFAMTGTTDGLYIFALEWMVDCGMTQVLFEMDCKVIVDRVNQLFSTQDTTDLGAIILQYPHTSGTISFGDASDVSGEGVATTPLVSEQVTPATYLPQEFYDRLVEELKVQSNMLPIHDDPDLGTQFCYRSETNLEGPILTAHFEGADVQLMPIQTFIPPKDGVFCFAMAGTTDGEYIFGNFAQSNVLIGFDLDRRTVSYKATDCTNR
ncbi:hypothetical protein JHK84_029986 [Glycine max]|nr:hypothetical protein JHK85_030377 [Glycine max]KAG4993020.1 hypothetical protein JHK86_029847 [Glycine max]KAG5144443.1 hypothetical protein JHK84_029986 [Glycine max]